MKTLFVVLGRILFAFRRRSFSGTPKRIVILKIGAIGDVLMSTPFVAAVRQNYPQAHITYVVGAWSADVIRNNPEVNEVRVFDDRGVWRGKLSALRELVFLLRSTRADVGFILDRHYMAPVMAWVGGIRYRVGFDRRGEGFACNLAIPFTSGRHDSEYYLDLIRAFSHNAIHRQPMRIFPTEEERQWGAAWWKNAGLTGPVICLMPGGAANPGQSALLKRWPSRHYAELTERILSAYPRVSILILGGPSDREIAGMILAIDPQRIRSAAGEGSIRQAAVLAGYCQLCVTHDSGPMHVAAASGVPVIAIFGPTDPASYAPLGDQHTVLFKPDLPGALCYTQEGSFPRDLQEVACMTAITPEEVLRVIGQRYAAKLKT